MTDNEIIKALECCKKDDCDNCPNDFGNCYANLSGYSLDLINRQKAEIERLKECPKCIYEYDGKTTEYCVQGPCSNFKTVEQTKSEAIKDFADRLLDKARAVQIGNLTWVWLISQDDINDIIKEMLVKSDERKIYYL